MKSACENGAVDLAVEPKVCLRKRGLNAHSWDWVRAIARGLPAGHECSRVRDDALGRSRLEERVAALEKRTA